MLDAIFGVAGRPDVPAFVYLAVQAEPWFARYQDWADKEGYLTLSVGCALLGGLKSKDRPLPSQRNRQMGARFLAL
ncbi:hypothetical protein ABTK17_19280, partial [Acinetobacter baumannii]